MRHSVAKRWLALLTSGVVLSSGSLFGSCQEFFNSFLGRLVSPGTGGLDTDGDGFTDAQELQAGTDSFDAGDHP